MSFPVRRDFSGAVHKMPRGIARQKYDSVLMEIQIIKDWRLLVSIPQPLPGLLRACQSLKVCKTGKVQPLQMWKNRRESGQRPGRMPASCLNTKMMKRVIRSSISLIWRVQLSGRVPGSGAREQRFDSFSLAPISSISSVGQNAVLIRLRSLVRLQDTRPAGSYQQISFLPERPYPLPYVGNKKGMGGQLWHLNHSIYSSLV